MFSTLGALTGLVVAILLIVRKVTPAYALIVGALVGGLLGGGGLAGSVGAMIDGTKAMIPSVLRVLASGILVGALVRTGSAAKIADACVRTLGVRLALMAVALATMIVCAVGVFIDIAIITVSPIALAVARKVGLPVPALLLAMIGGGKAGNVISPNPNTIAVSDVFKLDLTSLMAANLIPAVGALLFTVVLATWWARRIGDGNKSSPDTPPEVESPTPVPRLWAAVTGPLAVVLLLALRPLAGVAIDPLVALPVGGLACAIACRAFRQMVDFADFGLGKVAGVSILLLGTGTLAGIVKGSGLNGDVIALLHAMHLPMAALAPVSGVLMAAVTASTTAGATIAAQTFSASLLDAGVPALAAAAMMHAGATVADSLPHGSFFHATGGAVGMNVRQRLKLIPLEIVIGLVTTALACLCA